jgi:hypothetical protein
MDVTDVLNNLFITLLSVFVMFEIGACCSCGNALSMKMNNKSGESATLRLDKRLGEQSLKIHSL